MAHYPPFSGEATLRFGDFGLKVSDGWKVGALISLKLNCL